MNINGLCWPRVQDLMPLIASHLANNVHLNSLISDLPLDFVCSCDTKLIHKMATYGLLKCRKRHKAKMLHLLGDC